MIDVQREQQGKGYRAVALVPGTAGVTLFRTCFYETAVAQAFARDGAVMFDGQVLEQPRKLKWWERRELRREKGRR